MVIATSSACFGGDLTQHGIARVLFNQRQEGSLVLSAHHQIDFPVADPAFWVNNGRTLINTAPVFNMAPGIGFSVAFLAFILTMAQMLI